MSLLLFPAEKRVLVGMVTGSLLRERSDLEGRTTYALEDDAQGARPVRGAVVSLLQARQLVWRNQKFPTSTFVLTERGARVARALAGAKAMGALSMRG